jgi:hypothetical protein
MAPGTRQLFVYWRVGVADTEAALQAVRGWQQSLRAQHPALQTRLFLRHDAARDEATVMESYALVAHGPSPGIDARLQRQIEHDGTAALQHWLCGTRHVEVFDALDGG